jgi:hypothetical protein
MTGLQRLISLAALASTAFFAAQAAQASITANGDPRYQNASTTPTPVIRDVPYASYSGGDGCSGSCSCGGGV